MIAVLSVAGIQSYGADLPSAGCLWYDQPVEVKACSLPWAPEGAQEVPPRQIKGDVWESQTLPVGNGRVGGTVYGGRGLDCVVLNEVSLWTGGPNGDGSGYAFGPVSGKDHFGSFQPFGQLFVQYDDVKDCSNYKRWLTLRDAVVRSKFTAKKDETEIKHERECFVSKPDDVLVYAAKVNKPGTLNAMIALMPYHNVRYSVRGKNMIAMSGTLANGERFEGCIQVKVTGGSVSIESKGSKTLNVDYTGNGPGMMPTYQANGVPYLKVTGADQFVVTVSLATDYKMDPAANWKGSDPAKVNDAIMQAVRKKSAETMYKTHVAEFRSLYDRLTLKLGKTDPQIASLPMNQRLAKYRERQNDPELEETIYQLGRYMLVSGSRPGNLPLNLQGIWNNKVHAMWASDYHNNINLQMCYWGAEVANLSECHLPLLQFIDVMQKPLQAMTKTKFGSNIRGWTTRVSQNPWGGGGWTQWNKPVNAWYALHLWDHYLFTQDKNYLKKMAYPILKNICNFWEDYLKEVGENGSGLTSDGKPLLASEHPELKEIKKGSLVSPEGWSHEWGPNREDGCAHDQQLVWELFDNTVKAAKILKTDGAFANNITSKKNRLVGNRIGQDGYLQEWIVDRPNMVKGHRHTSHLIGVYPGTSISMARTPEFAKAAMKSLELRGSGGDNRRSWTWPWRTALWARFYEAEKAYEMVQSYLRFNVLDNLLGTHPPMQMDGTYGITGGMSEMLVQSHAGQIELLPALPAAWKDGSANGLRARGNITINMEWKNGKVTDLNLTTTSPNPKEVKVVMNGKTVKMTPVYTPAPGQEEKEAEK